MRRVVEAVAPSRMGRGFRWLLASEWLNQLGDGISLAAGPLLIASQTKNPTLVALAAVLQRAPWFLFGLGAGWIADRSDRRVIVAIAGSIRALLLFGLAAVISTGAVNVALVLVAMFLLGCAETFADSASGTLMPMLVGPRDLGVANARMSFGRRALNQLIGPPVGAAIFVAGLAAPFVTHAILSAFAAVLILKIAVGRPAEVVESRGITTDVLDGIKWLWRNPALRTLTLTVVLFNLTFGAVWPLLVLYSEERLGLGEFGFGILLSASAVGGLLGAVAYGTIERRVSLAWIMRAALAYETFMHLGLALSRNRVVSIGLLGLFGFFATLWGTTATAIRQRAVPENLQGRVGSVYLMGVFGGLIVGGALGAIISGIWGVVGPFWFAFAGSALMLAIVWRELPNVVHTDT